VGKISGQNTIVWFFHECLAWNRKSTAMIISRLQQPMGTNPFRLWLLTLRSTCEQDMISKSRGHFGYFPRKWIIKKEIYFLLGLTKNIESLFQSHIYENTISCHKIKSVSEVLKRFWNSLFSRSTQSNFLKLSQIIRHA